MTAMINTHTNETAGKCRSHVLRLKIQRSSCKVCLGNNRFGHYTEGSLTSVKLKAYLYKHQITVTFKLINIRWGLHCVLNVNLMSQKINTVDTSDD